MGKGEKLEGNLDSRLNVINKKSKVNNDDYLNFDIHQLIYLANKAFCLS